MEEIAMIFSILAHFFPLTTDLPDHLIEVPGNLLTLCQQHAGTINGIAH